MPVRQPRGSHSQFTFLSIHILAVVNFYTDPTRQKRGERPATVQSPIAIFFSGLYALNAGWGRSVRSSTPREAPSINSRSPAAKYRPRCLTRWARGAPTATPLVSLTNQERRNRPHRNRGSLIRHFPILGRARTPRLSDETATVRLLCVACVSGDEREIETARRPLSRAVGGDRVSRAARTASFSLSLGHVRKVAGAECFARGANERAVSLSAFAGALERVV